MSRPLQIEISLMEGGDISPRVEIVSEGEVESPAADRDNIEPFVTLSAIEQREDQRFVRAIASGLLHNTTIETMADECCLSASTFKRRFRSRYSSSPHSWLVAQRLNVAYKLIVSTDLHIGTLSALCGFSNTSHFIAQFRRRYSITPSRLRRESSEASKTTSSTIVIRIEL